jgi:predicted AAA+ superfamily ATPase
MYEREDEQFSFVAARTAVERALEGTYGLALFQHVLDDAAGRAFLHLLRMLTAEEQNAEEIAQAYSRAFRELAVAVSGESLADLPDAWQAYLIARMLQDTNPWSSQVECAGAASVAPSLRAQARRELRLLQQLFALGARLLWQLTTEAVAPSLPILRDAWVPWLELASSVQQGTHIDYPRRALAEQAARCDDWAALAEPLEHYWSRYGTGIFARYTVLRWQGAGERGKGLRGIAYPDPVQLADLVGYEREKSLLAANIERFLADLPAHHALLYGPPGTGKSSTVKALANRYAEEGLRLVEVRKEMINDLPALVPQLRERAPHFLVFIDDLSFEEHETAYKGLKVFLEGAVEARPTNVLIYATTNRFNLIRENFADRGQQSDDVHWRDTMEEKQSLVARFGLRVTFTTPDQERYLHIAAGIARRRGLIIPEETLRTKALQWERQHAGRSGRLARQFIDTLEAEMKKSNM